MKMLSPSTFLSWRYALVLWVPLGLLLAGQAPAATLVSLGNASGFGVLAATTITTAAGPLLGSTIIYGDIGVSPGTAITGTENLTVNGINHGRDSLTDLAQISLTAAYNDADSRTPDTNYFGVTDLGGMTLPPGVYHGDSSLAVTGTLTLNAGGDPNAVWIFQAESTLVTATYSNIVLSGGAQSSRVFWQVGSSATLETYSHFEGTILASTSISAKTHATINGGLLALGGAVTLDQNSISAKTNATIDGGLLSLEAVAATPEPSQVLLAGVPAAIGLGALLRRRVRPHPACAAEL